MEIDLTGSSETQSAFSPYSLQTFSSMRVRGTKNNKLSLMASNQIFEQKLIPWDTDSENQNCEQNLFLHNSISQSCCSKSVWPKPAAIMLKTHSVSINRNNDQQRNMVVVA